MNTGDLPASTPLCGRSPTFRSDSMEYAEEAETCRRKALAYVGQPEATFLLRVAKEFDRLETPHPGSKPHSPAKN